MSEYRDNGDTVTRRSVVMVTPMLELAAFIGLVLRRSGGGPAPDRGRGVLTVGRFEGSDMVFLRFETVTAVNADDPTIWGCQP